MLIGDSRLQIIDPKADAFDSLVVVMRSAEWHLRTETTIAYNIRADLDEKVTRSPVACDDLLEIRSRRIEVDEREDIVHVRLGCPCCMAW